MSCLERGADLHVVQLMLLPLTVSCFTKIHIVFTCLVPGHPGRPALRAVKWVCVCMIEFVSGTFLIPVQWDKEMSESLKPSG